MKIIYSWGLNNEKELIAGVEIKEWIMAGYDITSINHREELGIKRSYSPEELNRYYLNKNRKLFKLYDKIRKLSEDHDVFVVNYENVYHPDFIKSLKNIYTVIVSGDDPESSDFCSKPYVHAFDHSFAWGVNFDKNTKITDKFLEWGAKRVDFWPYGVRKDMYDSQLTEEDIYNKNRDIDLVYVGTPYLKIERIAKIKKAFPQIKIYGRGWNLKSILGEPICHKKQYGNWDWRVFRGGIKAILLGLGNVKELPMNEIVPLYQRSKIGINIHQSYDCGTSRLYQLPANGVMQICDCPEGLSQVFKIGKEVVTYHSIEEMIKLTKYYLEHDKERKEIAVLGFKRVMKDYKRLHTFTNTIEKIKKGMLEDKIKYF